LKKVGVDKRQPITGNVSTEKESGEYNIGKEGHSQGRQFCNNVFQPGIEYIVK